MDAWERLFRDEREALSFLLSEEFRKDTEMTLQEILEQLQDRIDFMAKMDDFKFSDWLGVYQAVAQVKQAIALETISKRLENWNAVGVPVEHVGGH
jgi:type II secretory pathway component PulL